MKFSVVWTKTLWVVEKVFLGLFYVLTGTLVVLSVASALWGVVLMPVVWTFAPLAYLGVDSYLDRILITWAAIMIFLLARWLVRRHRRSKQKDDP